jgi:uroporphyrinogen decarboxylase
MVDAVARAAEPYGDKVIFQEYRIKEKEGLQMMASLGVQNLPTIVMDGNIEFISQIPPINDIQAKIDGCLASKN